MIKEWADFEHKGMPQVLIVVPTRELCTQVTKDIEELASNRGIRTLAVYGGRAFEPQIEALQAGIEIVVGTPGRLTRSLPPRTAALKASFTLSSR